MSDAATPDAATPDAPAGDDPYGWLEEVDGERAMGWVLERNAETLAGLAATAEFATTRDAVREVLDSPAKIPEVSLIGDRLYNLWRDAEHPRGLWRRTTWDSYATAEPEWETVLDIDALNAAEGEDWVWHGAKVLRPDFRRALVDLSHGGSDADVTRELDLETLQWIAPEDGGFERPEAKGSLSWVDLDTVLVTTDLGPGTTTTSGYPRTVRLWRRGTPMAQTPELFAIDEQDLAVDAWHDHTPGFDRDFVVRAIDFYSAETWLRRPDGELVLIDVPRSAETSVHREWLLIQLREDWTPVPGGATHPAGSLLAAPLEAWLDGSRDLTLLFVPTASTSLAGLTWTRHHLLLTVLDDVRTTVVALTPPDLPEVAAAWSPVAVPGLPELGTVAVRAVDRYESDDVWQVTTGFTTPATLSVATVGAEPRELKSAPAFFDPEGVEVVQHFARSDDGTRVPYFLVRGTGAPADGTAATLLYGYGGFEISLLPSYSGALGRAWLAQGGVYALANIRGGGEYGPSWHQAALRENRHRAYQDFAAVARDLVARGVTTAAHLGIQGGSNGGLLTGNMLTQYPELLGAVVIQVPLLDMKRYSHLLAGASWMAEYGDPDDPDDWEFLRTFSPYHLLDGSRAYPPVLLTTSTRDDRVHPGHARKVAAWLRDHDKDVTYYENVEGGHGGAADNAQAAFMSALAYRFLAERLGLDRT
ncbi:prolyl oligopeptidase family serine peptidase [Actinotalea sp. M2MS4P-6]|uniref:prolyl oligopeptidase family serine peptidase n=1 Tax=Actinotalea sp. M2MS4P-6 TaxID=2983762 RepID=UPI0021E472F5|nr:prolyl oligopeptidase family serine peptidase [Actinotalea sp. M2MS4P-6]MCV2394052.1 prolyl oligopeptidase family serine peptidase [Actinotalea sp. M2MS4P-6]